MSDPHFGIARPYEEPDKYERLIMKVLQTTKPVATYAEAVMILREAYETGYGIHDHLQQAHREAMVQDADKKRPLSSVALHDAEDYCTHSLLYNSWTLYKANDVYSQTGMSFDRFLALPPDFGQFILKSCAMEAAKKARASKETIDKIAKSMPG